VPYEFLTEEWMTEAKRLRDEAGSPASPPAHVIRMNQVITGAPFTEEDILAYMDTSDGELKMELGALENPDLTVTVDYDTAKAIFVEQNPQAGMQAFMAGKIKVQGDMTKLMAMQQTAPDPGAVELAQKIKDMTA
jgi:putative sterol carrier protein